MKSVESLIGRVKGVLASRPTIRSHVWQSLANYTQTGFGVLFGILLARLLTPGDFGTYAYASALVVTALLPLNWSMAQVLIAEGGKQPALFLEALSFAWKVSLLKTAVVALLFGWLMWSKDWTTADLVAFIGFPSALNDVVGIHRAESERRADFKINFYNSILTISVSLGFGIPLALMGFGPFSLVLPAPLHILLQILLYQRATSLPVFTSLAHRHGLHFLSKGFGLWIIGTSDVALQRVDKLLVGGSSGDATLGNYTRAFSYAPLSHQLLNSLMTNPTISALARRTDPRDRLVLVSKTAGLVVAGGVLNWVAVWWLSPWLVPLVFGDQWIEAVPYFQAFAGLSLAYGISSLPAAILLSQRAYRPLAITKVITTGAILGGTASVLFLGHSSLLVPQLLVFGLIFQGIVLTALAIPFLRHGRPRIAASQ